MGVDMIRSILNRWLKLVWKYELKYKKTSVNTVQIIITPRKWWVWWIFIKVFIKRTFQLIFGGQNK
jgi:hypothetical protein